MIYPSLAEIKELSKEYSIIPVWLEVYADTETPISILRRLEDKDYCFLLESVEGGEKWARYSFIGNDPFLTVKSYADKTTIIYQNGEIKHQEPNPMKVIEKLMQDYKSPALPGIPRFTGGAVGFFGYDLVRHYESLPNVLYDDLKLPEAHFMLVDELLCFDHLKQKIHIIVNLHARDRKQKNLITEEELQNAYNKVINRIHEIYRNIKQPAKKPLNIALSKERPHNDLNIESNTKKELFLENVIKAKRYIKDGDIFQVVLSQRLCIDTQENPLSVYRALRALNPSPYMYYLKFDNYSVVGASPEMLVRVNNRVVETCPIAGTRKRGQTSLEDKCLEEELLADKKEVAEHTMLVDLGRNDIGKIAKCGTVKVRDLMHIEKYSHVMHIVTNVEGELREDKTRFDALASILPAGTLSGAPKVRAMQIIDELEPTKRGIYGGAIGYFGFDGNLDSCITIRTIVFKDDKAYIQAGAGIVSDSVPEKEYEECYNKAKALIKAIEEAREIV